MKTLPSRQCQICKQYFIPIPQRPQQKYCSNIACKKAGRSLWQRNRMQTDPEYKENQARINKTWHAKNLNYYKGYRANKKELAESVELFKQQLQEKLLSNSINYNLIFIEPINAKMDLWIVKLSEISDS